jgi:hypothetical protein
LLRKGNRATIQKVEAPARLLGLQPGDRITMGTRCNQGKTWTMTTEDGRELQLTHHQADALIVRLLED